VDCLGNAMLGRKRTGNKDAARTLKKRKWKDELSDDGSESDMGHITKADIDAWRETIQEEERQEQVEREKREREEREARKRKKDAEEAEQRRKEEEERQLLKESEDARKAAEEAEVERQRLEAEVAPPGPLPPDCPDVFPPGMRGDKMHLYKTMFCKRWEQGTCQFGAACHFAHGERELRGRPPKGSPPGTMSVPLPPELSKPVLGQLRVGDGRTLLQAASTVPPPPPPPPSLPFPLPCPLPFPFPFPFAFPPPQSQNWECGFSVSSGFQCSCYR